MSGFAAKHNRMEEITLEQANEASKLLERYVTQERSRISKICSDLREFGNFKKVVSAPCLEDMESLSPRAYNGLKTYIRHMQGVSQSDALFRISKDGLSKVRTVGKKTINEIEAVFSLYGINLLP